MKRFTECMASLRVRTFPAIALFVATIIPLRSQVWERKYGSSTSDEYGYSATPIQNASGGAGGYVEVGRTDIPGTEDIYVVKVDNNGTTLWQKTYDFGMGTNDVAMSVFECANGDLLVAGTTGDQTATGTCNPLATDNIFLMRLDEDGWLLWARTFGGRDGEGEGAITNLKVIETSVVNAGDIVIASSTQSFGNGSTRTLTPDNQITGDRDGFLIRTDASGDIIWAKAYGVPAPLPLIGNPQLAIEDYFTSVSEAINGDLIAVGVTRGATPNGPELPWIVRTSSNGLINPLSTTNYVNAYVISDPAANPTTLNTRIYAGRECPSAQNYQNIIMTGACDTKEPGGATNTELYLFAVTNTGIPLANLTCGDYSSGTTGLDEGRDVIETSAARFVAVGTTTNLGAPGRGTAVYAIEVNKANNPTPPPLDVMTKTWSRTYGDAWDDQGWTVAEVDNSGAFGTPGLLLGGSSYSAFKRSDWQMYLLKVFGTNGSTECSDVPEDQFTVPTMTTANYGYRICKVFVQGNRMATVTVRNWTFDPLCDD